LKCRIWYNFVKELIKTTLPAPSTQMKCIYPWPDTISSSGLLSRTFWDPSARFRARILLQVTMNVLEAISQTVCASFRFSLRSDFQKPFESAIKSVDVLKWSCDKGWLHIRTNSYMAIMDCADTISRSLRQRSRRKHVRTAVFSVEGWRDRFLVTTWCRR
jgi:hypothetical protein